MNQIFDFRMVGKLRESALLFYENLGLYLAIILPVALPANLLVRFIKFLFATDGTFLLNSIVNLAIIGISYAVYMSALIYTLARNMSGYHVEYTEAIGVGLRYFGRLFIARLIAGLIITFGFVLLIVPGIWLLIRYSLLDFTVVLEGASASEARKRSALLTEGFWWQIFWVILIFGVLNFVFTSLLTSPLKIFGGDESLLGDVIIGCADDVLYSIFMIALFLIYWERMGFAQTETDEPDPSATAP